jgi:hypothetical protein
MKPDADKPATERDYKTRGFPSPPHDGVGFGELYIQSTVIIVVSNEGGDMSNNICSLLICIGYPKQTNPTETSAYSNVSGIFMETENYRYPQCVH